MTSRTTPRLLRAMRELSGAQPSKAARGTGRGATIMHLWGSCGALALRRAGLPLRPAPISTHSCSFINLASPISRRRMDYNECRTLEYSPEQMYNVVASVDQYRHFVPWCKRSRLIKGQNGRVRAELEIGFPPIVERYTSEVTFVPNHQVRAVCTDGSLFSHLETIWRFAPADKDLPASCKVEFSVSFEFKSLLHSQLANVFFDEVVKQMVNAFESRAATLYKNQQEAPLRRRST
ncbi:coenzyme Q-binding protein COQ10 homolog, mitochondrial [Clinocottus analis]|uniref:coenzyme Q-binding protein COQ10 homolog, mitochondrial n=1 Tax=Clinocottus analis TaxID=304258 RepID=UPI0035C04979